MIYSDRNFVFYPCTFHLRILEYHNKIAWNVREID